jgi:probable HAF family extracellular repeat protein
MKTPAKLFASVLLGLLASSALFATDYRYTTIDVPNGSQTIARGINAHGDVIGSYTDSDGVGHDFLFHNGVFSTIVYPGNKEAAARALNARGDIVGSLADADGDHGFLLRDGKITKIDFPGAVSTIAFGINNSGDITGQYTTQSGAGFGFILRDGRFDTILVRGNDPTSTRGAEDNARVMVGDVDISADSSTRGFVRYKPGDVQLLKPPGTIFPCSHARGINERGDVAGAFAIVHTSDECHPPNHGFVFRQSAYDVIDPAGSVDTFVFGINDDGIVIGVFTDEAGNLHGFKATPKN